MSSSKPKLANPSFQKSEKANQEAAIDELEQMYKHKFSWMDDVVDIRDECPLCMVYVNSPCYDAFSDYNKLDDVKLELKNSIRKEKTSEKELEYKLYVQKTDLAWDKLMKCVNPQQELYLNRQKELRSYINNVQQYEKKALGE
ncbi:predicted protein [Naegleria gruberi]|uniref:Predicted protein n=1 Tax=Naegleria gruberi TaxID=5762 RepID=D2VXQ6_NAEGR|nr:uncharacterized protein NAEGRDRAFT_59523 [Naegleria gruberi]EFC38332.1 predicted protein [Naegleria gruberi]|eukprot:XP_002671076.1 predicted protein [Naegleria gruberi strain NEG-M]